MRIPSGKTDQKIFFVAVDATDLVTRKTGLSGFTVYRSRNGGAATVYTTPTIAELSAANMPGVYSLLIDEDTTVASTSDSEEYCVHITCTGMAPVTRTMELYRRGTTSGRTLAVDANSRVDVGAVLGTAQTAGDLAALITSTYNRVGAPVGASISADIAAKPTAAAIRTEIDTNSTQLAAIKAKTDNLPTDPADESLIIAATDAIYSRIGAPVGLSISADIANIPTAPTAASIRTEIDTNSTQLAAIKVKTDNLPSDPADESLIIAATDAIYNRIGAPVGLSISADIAGIGVSPTAATIRSEIDTNSTQLAAIKAKTDNLPSDPADESLVIAATDAIYNRIGAPAGLSIADDIAGIGAAPTAAAIRTEIDTNSTQLAAIKAKTDNLPADPADASDIAASFSTVEAAIAAVPTSAQNADAIFDRANGIETGMTLRQAIRLMSAVMLGKSSGHPGSPVYRDVNDLKDRVTATVSSGNRSVVILDAT